MNWYSIREITLTSKYFFFFASLLIKGTTINGKNLLPVEANSFHLRVDFILKGVRYKGSKLPLIGGIISKGKNFLHEEPILSFKSSLHFKRCHV